MRFDRRSQYIVWTAVLFLVLVQNFLDLVIKKKKKEKSKRKIMSQHYTSKPHPCTEPGWCVGNVYASCTFSSSPSRRSLRYWCISLLRNTIRNYYFFFHTPLCRSLGWREEKFPIPFLKIPESSGEKVCALLIKNYKRKIINPIMTISAYNNRGHTLTLRAQRCKSSLPELYINVIISNFRLSKVLGFSAYLLTNSDNV